MEFMSEYGGHKKVTLDCGKDTVVQQQYRDECDVNNILRRYEQTGVLPEMRDTVQAVFGDFSNLPDYQAACNVVINANMAFASLDAKTRDRFGNDPAKLVEFCQDDKNYDEAVKLGLAVSKPKVTPDVKLEEGVKGNPKP